MFLHPPERFFTQYGSGVPVLNWVLFGNKPSNTRHPIWGLSSRSKFTTEKRLLTGDNVQGFHGSKI